MNKYQKKIKAIERILDEEDRTEKAPYPLHFEIEWTWYRRLQTFLIGPLTTACGAIYLDRENRDSRSATVHEINKRVKTEQPLPQLIMFPEGAVTNGKSLLQFKPGAFIPRVPVQPVAVSFEGWRTGTCSKGTNQAWLLLVSFANLRMELRFDYLPVVTPLENEDPISFSSRVRVIFSEHTGLKSSNISFENTLIHFELKRLGLPFESMDVDLKKLMKCLDYKVEDIHLRLQEFAKLRDPEENIITIGSAI
ncbi:Oidioi.mRNA.OKI2018_I69.chr1.g1409.t1.cds [Oikopleura dioica]|uniref:Oidioi.mRNA.OKI2018_I69.chr1.g1409.t1.cds n=1 Tax=Oikopleura dioica TaxID=34765 RepID=A0ABN7SMT5_OIKDI|nr:Oidioi.mRNA.OKI2018_I69.chr1.g1409.t1.cds [Oikopleura dioica]